MSETLKDHLASLDQPADLEALIDVASKIDKRLIERQEIQQDHFQFALVSQERVYPPVPKWQVFSTAPSKEFSDRPEQTSEVPEPHWQNRPDPLHSAEMAVERERKKTGALHRLPPGKVSNTQPFLLAIGESSRTTWNVKETSNYNNYPIQF